jgi:PAB1-binding protein PBP1
MEFSTEVEGDLGGCLEDSRGGKPQWDQFAVNEKKYGVASTYKEEYYTTRLDRYVRARSYQ